MDFVAYWKTNVNQTNIQDNKFPLISVIILTYKQQNHLYETIQSVLEQDYPNIEFILSDDASGCLDEIAIKKYIDDNKKSNIVSYLVRVNEKNLGTVKHANLTLKYVTGQYIKFVPCGDKFFNRTSLSELYKFAENVGGLVISSVVMVSSEDFTVQYYKHPNVIRGKMIQTCTSEELFRKLCVSNFIAAVSILFRRDFFDIFKFDEKYRLLEDWPLWLRISRYGIKIYHLNKVTMYYSDGGISRKDGDAYTSDVLRDDMLKCFEFEIIPFIHDVEFIFREFIIYKYYSMKGKNKLFFVKYVPFIMYDNIKRILKFLLKWLK